MSDFDYDLIVIGSGPAGQRAAIQAAKLDKRVALIERKAVLGGVCYLSAAIASPGVVRQNGTLHRLVFGEFDGRASSRVAALLDAATRAGIAASLTPDVRRVTWEKFVFLVGLSATSSRSSHVAPSARVCCSSRKVDRVSIATGVSRAWARSKAAARSR